MKNIKIEFTNERIIPASGLAVVGAILGKSDFVKRCNRMDVTKNRSQHQIKNGDILLTYIGLLTMGKPAYESVHEFDDDQEFYKYALGITRNIPSEETLRQRMDDIGASLRPQILSENIEMLRTNGIVPGKLPNGYAPIMAYIGTEGYLINCELREGKQHCQKHTRFSSLSTCRGYPLQPLLCKICASKISSSYFLCFMV